MIIRAYVRVSTDEQAEEGFSLPAQRQRIADFARSQWGGAPDIVWYADDGYSASDTNRPRLQALRRDCHPGDLVVVLRLDRLTRSVLDLFSLLQEWDRAGVFFRSVTEPYDTQKPEGRFMLGLLALLAEWERLRIGERVREVMAHTVRSQGRHLSRAPFGYDLADSRLVVNPTEAATVREIFHLYLGGLGLRTIARRLNDTGRRTKQGALWSDFAVGYVLRNPVYTGQVAWQRIMAQGKRKRSPGAEAILADGGHEALIDPSTFSTAQSLLTRRHNQGPAAAGSAHALTGLAYCARCGGPLHGVLQRRYRGGKALPGQERFYYRCSRREHQGACDLPYLPGGALERRVLDALGPPEPRHRLLEAIRTLTPRREDPAADLARLNRARRRWDEAYEAGDIDRAEWKAKTEALQARIAALPAASAPSAEHEDPAVLAGAMADLPSLWPHLTPTEQKAVLTAFVSRITVAADGSICLAKVTL